MASLKPRDRLARGITQANLILMRNSIGTAALTATLLLGACTAGIDRRAYLNQLVGQPETELVRQLGVPTRTFETGGRKFLAYEEEHPSEIYGGGFAGGFGGYRGGFGDFGFTAFPVEVVPYRCETTFEVENQRVMNWALRGNACG